MTQQKLTLENAEDLQVALEGCPRPLRLVPALSKGGNVYWTIPGASMYGVPIKAQAKNLPESAQVINPKSGKKSEKVPLAVGVTNDLRPRSSGGAKVTLPTQGRDERLVSVTISIRKDGTWNVKASARGVGGGSNPRLRDDSVLS